MECGKLTAKLRDAVPVCLMVNDHEVKRYKNIEIPEEIKHLEYCGFQPFYYSPSVKWGIEYYLEPGGQDAQK